ncbi:alpha/beta family hydrolase [Microbacterium koreense]|uniref:Alpha/beta family hydrolase n=1 Tax=Microbacterium koreense TaxID=323761 RepID=A0ABW2ZRU3_9MICO
MTASLQSLRVELPKSTAEVSLAVDRPADAWAIAPVAHGAGSRFDHPFLTGFADGLASRGIATVRFNFPYAEAGRRMPGPAPHAIATWRAVDERCRDEGLPVWAIGKSYGGRMASMAAAEGAIDPTGLVYLGYPLHPPGAPEKLRCAHLPAVTQPQLFLSGTGDPFVQPANVLDEIVRGCPDATMTWIPGGHSFERKREALSPHDVGESASAIVADWIGGR